jgi:hypothetical protein
LIRAAQNGLVVEASVDDKPFRSVIRCAHCGRAKNQHRAGTLECPRGKRTPSGYMQFGSERFELAATKGGAAKPKDRSGHDIH